jgi:hypothetical protein
VVIAAAAMAPPPAKKALERAVDDAMTRVKDRVSQVAERAGQAIEWAVLGSQVMAMAATTLTAIVELYSVKTLADELGLEVGKITHNSAGILYLSQAIRVLLRSTPSPPHCNEHETNYKASLGRANNAFRGGDLKMMAKTWTNFVTDALKYVLCIKGKDDDDPPTDAAGAW